MWLQAHAAKLRSRGRACFHPHWQPLALSYRQPCALPRRLLFCLAAGPCSAAAGCLLLLEICRTAAAALGQVAVEMHTAHLKTEGGNNCPLCIIGVEACSQGAVSKAWLASLGSRKDFCSAECQPVQGCKPATHHVLYSRVARREQDMV